MSLRRVALAAVLLAAQAAFAWPPNFTYRRAISVNNGTAAALTGYQVLVVLDTATPISEGKMRAGCTDLRFADADGDTLLPFWLESGCGTATTRAWVRVPSLPAGTSPLYAYYGDPLLLVGASNGDATFDFFDDFPGTTLNTAKWTAYAQNAGAAARVDAGQLQLFTFGGALWTGAGVNTVGKFTFNKNNGAVIEWVQGPFHVAGVNCFDDCGNHTFWVRTPVCGRDSNYGGPTGCPLIHLSLTRSAGTLLAAIYGTFTAGGTTGYLVGGSYPPPAPIAFRFELSPSSGVRVYLNDVQRLDATVTAAGWTSLGTASVLELYNGNYMAPLPTNFEGFRAFRVRQWASAVPSVTVGSENAPCLAVVCTALDQCHDVGVCDNATGICSNPVKLNGTACDDANACTASETCQAGTCGAPATTVTCSALDQCHVAGTCSPATGVCSDPPKQNGLPCDDGNACTTGESCQAGACGGTVTNRVCLPSDQCHVAGVCDPGSGACSNPPAVDGVSCTDGNACTSGETCQAGVCRDPTGFVQCMPLDACHVAGVCSPATGGCSNPAKPNGVSCDDANACTAGETCQGGRCANPTAVVTCPAVNACHFEGVCNPGDGACAVVRKPDGAACDDANACTSGDRCVAGACTPMGATVCPAADACHAAGVCDAATGACSQPALPDGTACSDGSACTTSDACVAGACRSGAAVTCPPPADQCHAAGVCDPTSGACSSPARPDGAPCDDGNACTTLEMCVAGVCGSPLVTKQCAQPTAPCREVISCAPSTGACGPELASPNGTACPGGVCQAGACVDPASLQPPLPQRGCGCASSPGALLLAALALVVGRRREKL